MQDAQLQSTAVLHRHIIKEFPCYGHRAGTGVWGGSETLEQNTRTQSIGH